MGPTGIKGVKGADGNIQTLLPKPDQSHTLKPGPETHNFERQTLNFDFWAGKAGPHGDNGNQGPRGPEGPRGRRGRVGPRGKEGPMGATGAQGEAGKNGIMGPQV